MKNVKRYIEIGGVLVAGIGLASIGRTVAWLVPPHREAVRARHVHSEDQLPGITKFVYEYSSVGAVVLLILGIAIVCGGLWLRWKRVEVFEVYALAMLTLSLTVILFVGLVALGAFVFPLIPISHLYISD